MATLQYIARLIPVTCPDEAFIIGAWPTEEAAQTAAEKERESYGGKYEIEIEPTYSYN